MPLFVVVLFSCKSGNPVASDTTWNAVNNVAHDTTWSSVNNGLTDTVIYDLTNIGTTMYAGGWGHGVFRSSDEGDHWFASSTGLQPYVSSLCTVGQKLYAATNLGVFLSTDNASSWREITTTWDFKYINAIASDGSYFYASSQRDGVFVTSDDGVHWSSLNDGIPLSKSQLVNYDVVCLTCVGTDIYAGVLGAGIFLLRGGDTTWTLLGGPTYYMDAIVVNGGSIFAATRTVGVMRSNDKGSTWKTVNKGLPSLTVNSLLVVGSQLYAGVYESGVFRTLDNGDTWSQFRSGLPSVTVLCLLAENNTLFAGTYGKGVWRFKL